MKQSIDYILNEASYLEVFLLTLGYFVVLYFLLGPSFLWVCKQLEKRNWLNKIVSRKLPKNQLKFEIKHSTVSVLIFGLSAIPVIYLMRIGKIELLENNWSTILFGVLLLNVLNELHYSVHYKKMKFI